ncbi:MAG: ABC transporter ATP-binding protein [Verrucomicrobia bacterium]|nr:ABC transporter ATP-binding protein [Verrucomicrobiota bacterium]MCH8514552.1 ABC transporter ATP-binding protein/permease [Kiritimatiellia bacterium]
MAESPKKPGMFRRFVQLTHPYRAPLRGVYALYLLNAILNLLPAFSLRYYFDLVVDPQPVTLFGIVLDPSGTLEAPRERMIASGIYFASMCFLILSANLVGVWMWRLGTRVSQRFILDIKLRIHHHLHKLSISFFDKSRSGDLMSRTVGDVEQMEHMIRQSFNILYGFIHLTITPLLMIGMSPWLFLATLVPVPVIYWSLRRIRLRLRPMYREMREQQAVIGATIQENISGIREVRAFNREAGMRRTYGKASIAYTRTVNDSMKVFSVNHQILYGIRDFAMILVGVVGGLMVVGGFGGVTLGVVVAFIPLLNRFFDPIGQLVNFYDVLQRGLASTERVFAFLDLEPEGKDLPHAHHVDFKKGEVVFEDVCFSYDPVTPVLKNISLHVNPGETVAIVGATGSGKSTLISLLLRFYEPTSGRVCIDGHDIRRIAYSSVSRSIGIVFQETFLFHGTMADNIGFSRDNASMEDIRDAARQARIADEIESLPDQYDTLVGERGLTLSGGQRQRIAIARLILKDPTLVILDEATSAVDTRTERDIQESLEEITRERTTFIIAHRLSTVRRADRIVVLDHGQIVEQGTHESLLAENGFYAELLRHNEIFPGG